MTESLAEFARRKGWHRSTATRRAQQGKLVLTEDGQVDVEASEARLAATSDPTKEGVRQRHARTRRGAGGGDRDGHDDGIKANSNDTTYQLLTKHRAAAEYNRAELLRLELEEKEGRLVDAEAVRKYAFGLARAARNALVHLRFRIDPLLAGETDRAKRMEVWDRETRAICDELARGLEVAVADGSG